MGMGRGWGGGGGWVLVGCGDQKQKKKSFKVWAVKMLFDWQVLTSVRDRHESSSSSAAVAAVYLPVLRTLPLAWSEVFFSAYTVCLEQSPLRN